MKKEQKKNQAKQKYHLAILYRISPKLKALRSPIYKCTPNFNSKEFIDEMICCSSGTGASLEVAGVATEGTVIAVTATGTVTPWADPLAALACSEPTPTVSHHSSSNRWESTDPCTTDYLSPT